MEHLVKKRGSLKAKLTRTNTFLASLNVDAYNVEDVETKLEILEESWKTFQEVHYEILLLCVTEQENEENEFENEDFENRYVALKTRLLRLTNATRHGSPSTAAPVQTQATTTHRSPEVKLPRIELPKFSGEYQEWTSFYDQFRASVHNNTSLAGAQKLNYLKASLDGNAKELLRSIPISDANYTEAWTILKDRYENKRNIVYSHLKSLCNQQNLQSENASGLRKLLDTMVQNIRALKVLGEPVDQWDSIVVYLLSAKLDAESRRQWELSLANSDLPTMKQFQEFLKKRCGALEIIQTPKQKTSNKQVENKASDEKTTISFHVSTSKCPVCNSNSHYISRCPDFLKATIKERTEIVKQNRLCYNCLRGGHSSVKCTSGVCRECDKKHNSLLHFSSHNNQNKSGCDSAIVTNHAQNNENQVLLSTAIVNVMDKSGNLQKCRAFLDNGSQGSFISESCIQRLGLKRSATNISFHGVTLSSCSASGVASVHLESSNTQFKIRMDMMVLSTITKKLPNSEIKKPNWHHIKNLTLADPFYYKRSEIDILLGMDIYADLILNGLIKGPVGAPTAQKTVLGWILLGNVNNGCQSTSDEKQILSNHMSMDLENQLQQFWKVEEVQSAVPALSQEEKQCEAHFASTHTRDSSGRYVVQLPMKSDDILLGDSRRTAEIWLKQIERRLQCNEHRKVQYYTFMKEYLDNGHMELVPPAEIKKPVSDTFYFPHHFVTNENRSTTKLRVVFNGSKKTSTKASLNDKSLVGPKLQQDLFQIVLRFRIHQIALTADIAKMYRQIWVDKSDVDYQRILWRDSPNEPIQDYRLLTVTYGTSSAPYLATKVLQQLSYDEEQEFPLAAAVVRRDFYVDDLMSGANDITSALQLQDQLIKMMEKGGLQLRKWSSNKPELLDSLPPDYRETKTPLEFDMENSIRTLGILWHPALDQFSFKVELPDVTGRLTKRGLLSDVAQIFDPVGWLAPTVIFAKLLFQRLWLVGISWDEALPDDVTEHWMKFRSELSTIENIKVNRWIYARGQSSGYQLHGFSDASISAFSAVVYFRTVDPEGNVKISILCAKTKVAPIKQLSLPRLELCGALLLARLVCAVKESLTLEYDSIYCWTDSTIVLSWLIGHPNRWKTFVANRVSEIQDLVPPQHWNHVRSEDNPADVASRGIYPSELEGHELWWNGPSWLSSDYTEWPTKSNNLEEVDLSLLEQKKLSVCAVIAQEEFILLKEYSSLTPLIRVTSYCLRFINNTQKNKEKYTGSLSTKELQKGLHGLIKNAQSLEFRKEIAAFSCGKPLSSRSQILSLRPFMDEEGLLRVGGRLSNSPIPFEKKHQILLPRRSKLTTLIVDYEHLRNLHAGPRLLLSVLQARFWIVCARDVIRKRVHKCVICCRHRAITTQQIMGDLPKHRVEAARPFIRTGVDYAGPVHLRASSGRGRKQTTKGYIALFICFCTKAIHLELVSDLTSDSFLAALKRFTSRRGICSDIYSDNGTTFVGAANEMAYLHDLATSSAHNEMISRCLAKDGTNWHRIPATASHFGGFWEAGIKSCKYYLRRVIGNASLTFEEMTTILCQVEACLNSRPLCELSSDPEDLSALTPGHFLIGDALTAIPEPGLFHLKLNRLSRWQLVQRLTQQFWNQWQTEYLARLQQRPKWTTQMSDLKIGDLVLVKDDQLPPLKWNLGRILEVHRGKDDAVRVVTVKTQFGLVKRPIVKICLLPVDTN